eukprot:Macronucleus_7960.p1 GENE.Macronucleus_7960~~Macronucleus_7960.p1  ORF type:complete len:127 (+),score=29.66 Macronucleus_7960:1-381(+)
MATPAVASYSLAQTKQALRLYRNLMKLQMRKVPDELRPLGDLMIKQEFRLHLDSATEDQMGKFLVAWGEYARMLDSQLDTDRSMNKMKKVLHDPHLDGMLKDKMTEEQQGTLKEFKDVIFDAAKKQ